ncbi:MAG TPA: transglutaminase-like domain-containing protein [Planctomycetaceae bacterium]|jgi:regulator of sirC expression with transglutaminase-like and TPR domain|nr:transglutaminase-like domain-containing protein [Planctomycetaceae bacterium]
MSAEPSYACDAEFLKLFTRRADVDLTVVALELARDAQPGLDFRPTLEWLDARGRELSGAVARSRTEDETLRLLVECLSERHGIFGDADCYERAESSFLNRVIETGRGLPITLSILYIAVAQRVGIDLRGVSAPKHFLTRYESIEGTLFVDPFAHGRIVSQRECLKWLCGVSGLRKSDVRPSLKPVGSRTIVIRMLNNLKALYVRQENWHAAWMVQHRLTALAPCSYQERRDLALISLRANRPGHAVDLLRSCLRTCSTDEKPALERHLQEASSQLCRWN